MNEKLLAWQENLLPVVVKLIVIDNNKYQLKIDWYQAIGTDEYQ